MVDVTPSLASARHAEQNSLQSTCFAHAETERIPTGPECEQREGGSLRITGNSMMELVHEALECSLLVGLLCFLSQTSLEIKIPPF